MKKSLFILFLAIFIALIFYIIYSFLNVREGTIIVGTEAIVFTERKADDIKEYDYHINGNDWVWIGNDEKYLALLKDPQYYKYLAEDNCLEVKIRYINLFFHANASYVERAKMPQIYILKIIPVKACNTSN